MSREMIHRCMALVVFAGVLSSLGIAKVVWDKMPKSHLKVSLLIVLGGMSFGQLCRLWMLIGGSVNQDFYTLVVVIISLGCIASYAFVIGTFRDK